MDKQPKRRGYFSVERVFGRAANQILRRFGYEVVRYSDAVSQHAALNRLKSKNLNLKTIIDVGASDGRWTRELLEYYPDAAYLLIEANEIHQPQLNKFASQHPNVDYLIGVAGREVGEVLFDGSDLFGGTATNDSRLAGPQFSYQPSVTIDQQIKQRHLLPPYFIKLDTHGFEIPILEGAQETLKQTDLLLIETYNFELTPESVLFYEMCEYLTPFGFRPVDICAPLFRPLDKTLWQFDLFFIADHFIQGKSFLDG